MNLYTYDLPHIIHFNLMNASVNSEIHAINKFVLYNVDVMQPWIILYEEKKMKCDGDKK